MIEDIKLKKVMNSAKKEALEVQVTSNKKIYFASVPVGTSRGKYESNDDSFVLAKKILEKNKKYFIGIEGFEDADSAIRKIDGNNISKFGGNLSLGLQLATARAMTNNELWKINGPKSGFPTPLVNVIGGGKHGGNTDFQELLIFCEKAKTFPEAYKRSYNVWQKIGKELKKRKLLAGKNLENAWITKMDNIETLKFVKSLGLKHVKIGLDFAASSLWDGKNYVYKNSGKTLSKNDHFEFIQYIIDEFDLFYMEDPFHEEDFESFASLTRKTDKCLVVGDDLTTTNPSRFQTALKINSVTGIIVKPNQVGSLVKTQKVVEMAKKNKITIIPSHRSSETPDNWQADLCIAWDAKIFKSGIAGFDKPKLERLLNLWKKIPHAKMNSL